MKHPLTQSLPVLAGHTTEVVDEIVPVEEMIEEETPVFTGDHGDSCFDGYQAAINEIFASCDLYPIPITE